MTRKSARKLGLKKYTSGTTCKRGHAVYRYTKTGQCSACLKDRNRKTNRIMLWVSPEDVAAVRELIEALGIARSLTNTVNAGKLVG